MGQPEDAYDWVRDRPGHDRRYEEGEGPDTIILTGNAATSGWPEFFTGDGTLLCTLDLIFDKTSRVHDARPELPREEAERLLGGGGPVGNQAARRGADGRLGRDRN